MLTPHEMPLPHSHKRNFVLCSEERDEVYACGKQLKNYRFYIL
jgi:hypothetical protein